MKKIYSVMTHSGHIIDIEAEEVHYTREHVIFKNCESMSGIFPIQHIVGVWELASERAVAVRRGWEMELNPNG